MKRKIALSLLFSVLSISALAEDTRNVAIQRDSEGLFVGIHGGGAWMNSIAFAPKGGILPATIHVNYSPGYDAAANFGYYYHGFAMDLTGGLIQNNARKIRGGIYPSSKAYGDTRINYSMVDLSYMDDNFRRFLPYGGFGVGYANMRHNINNVSHTLQVKTADTRLAYQVFLGMGYAFNDHWLLGLDYHFLGTWQGHFRPKYQGSSYRSWDASYVSFVNLGLSYLF